MSLLAARFGAVDTHFGGGPVRFWSDATGRGVGHREGYYHRYTIGTTPTNGDVDLDVDLNVMIRSL